MHQKNLEEIVAHYSEEAGVLIPQIIEVLVFGCVYESVLVGFIHCACIIVYSPPFVMLKFEFLS